MKKTNLTGWLASVALFALVQPAFAGPLEDGERAYQIGDYATALRIWRSMARAGYAPAQNDIGMMYAQGLDVPLDRDMAKLWYGKAAAQGFAMAQLNLGDMLADPQGRTPHYDQAAEFYRKAADQGLGAAQRRLGVLYRDGRGVERDPVKALTWFDIAATHGPVGDYQGRAEAAKLKSELSAKLSPAQVAEAEDQARSWVKVENPD
jgi:TPR repeat protein